MEKGFIAEYSSSVKVFQSRFMPKGTCVFIADGEVDSFIEWLSEAEAARKKIAEQEHRIKDLEYSIAQCDPKRHTYAENIHPAPSADLVELIRNFVRRKGHWSDCVTTSLEPYCQCGYEEILASLPKPLEGK